MKRTSMPTIHLILLILVLAVSGALFYLTQRQMSSVNRLQAEVNLISQSRDKLTDLSENLPTILSEADIWQRTLPRNEEDVAKFATQIEQMAKTQDLIFALDFDDFPGPIDIGGKYIDGLGANVTLEGNYQGVTNFLTRLSGLPYFFKVDKLALSAHESGSGVKAVINGALMMDLGNQK
ncbi:hypothetical protein HYS10_00330 [Candidatus Collierbacteria bacterium]|nr:hypothetical protein [Candidatus Collierbacteria bacterium]